MKLIKTEEAVGHVLCHDITEIVKDVRKGARFRKGHIVTEEDIPVLLRLGKENLYVWENDETTWHEDEAAEILCALSLNDGMTRSEPKEGKIELTAARDGLLKVRSDALRVLNSQGEMMIACQHGNFPVRAGDKLAGMRVIPLVIKKEKMEAARVAVTRLTGGKPLFAILPYMRKKVAILTTGSEVYKGRIADTFTPVIKAKLAEYGAECVFHKLLPDDDRMTTAAIREAIEAGAELVLVTGGMSVDPDDRTPLAIRNTGARVVSYGAPVLPGAMFLLAYYEAEAAEAGALASADAGQDAGLMGHAAPAKRTIPVMGLPGCVMYAKRTIFDLVLPRVLADDPVTAEDLAALGEGGLCLNCQTCTFPNCGFGK